MAGKAAPKAPESPVFYRVNGGEPIHADDMAWGQVTPWDAVERKTVGAPWYPVPPAPPILAAEVAKSDAAVLRGGSPTKFHLEGPIWPPRYLS